MEKRDTLGGRIQAGRKAAGLSQEALGERLGVSRQAVSKWEACRTGAGKPHRHEPDLRRHHRRAAGGGASCKAPSGSWRRLSMP